MRIAQPDEGRTGSRNGHGWHMGKLPAEGTQARRFGKTRSAQSTALLEDYAELIADLLDGEGEARPTDIARRLGVSHATAIKTISRLKRAGLATARPYRGRISDREGPRAWPIGCGFATAWWWMCCARSACRPNRRRPTPKASSTTSPRTRSKRSRSFSKRGGDFRHSGLPRSGKPGIRYSPTREYRQIARAANAFASPRNDRFTPRGR